MGRTVPTFRQLIEDAMARWSKFRRALRREDQEYFDRVFRRVRSYTQAATYQASDNPMEAILLSIALDQEKRLDALERAAQPPEKRTRQLDAPVKPDVAGQLALRPDGQGEGQREGQGDDRADTNRTNRGMAARSLPEPARDEAVADHGGSDPSPAD